MHRRDTADLPEIAQLPWQWWLPASTAAIAISAAAVAVWQRVSEGWPAPAVDAALLAVAVTPFLVDVSRRWLFNRIAWAAVILAPTTAVLVRSATETDAAPFILVVMAIQAGATSRLATGAVALAGGVGVMTGLEVAGEFTGAAIWSFGMVGAFAGGHAVQKSLLLLVESEARQAEVAERSATEERQRIAREVHDIVAHSLSVTLLHLTGARRVLETEGDTAEAVDALRDAEHLGRQAMVDIRRTVGLLEPGAGGETAPMPGAPEIAGLVDEYRAAGLDIDWGVDGDSLAVPPALGLGLYRIAQESLANVAKHAPGARAELRLELAGDPVRLLVCNGAGNGAPASVPAGGLGLAGMHQRAALLGGRCTAGRDGDGWRVEVELPRDGTTP